MKAVYPNWRIGLVSAWAGPSIFRPRGGGPGKWKGPQAANEGHLSRVTEAAREYLAAQVKPWQPDPDVGASTGRSGA